MVYLFGLIIDTAQRMQFEVTRFKKKTKRIEIIAFFICMPNFSLWEWRHNETRWQKNTAGR